MAATRCPKCGVKVHRATAEHGSGRDLGRRGGGRSGVGFVGGGSGWRVEAVVRAAAVLPGAQVPREAGG